MLINNMIPQKLVRAVALICCTLLIMAPFGSVATAYPKDPGDIYIWDAKSFSCNFTGPVWCASDTLINTARHFYLTNTSYSPSAAKTACATGYHMASMWEILNVSKLVYEYDHPSAYVKADSGWGPPSFWYGWIRTGYDSSNSSLAGTGNCNNWSSASTSDYGVSVRISRTWELQGTLLPIVRK